MRVALTFCLAIILGAVAPGPGATLHARTGTAGSFDAGTGAEATALLAVYLTIRQPRGTFILDSSRQISRRQREELQKLASERRFVVLLPEVANILDEAMMAARIAAHDLSGLRRAAAALGSLNLLAGRLVKEGPQKWSVNWSFSNAVGRRRWSKTDVSFREAMTSGLDMAADVLGGRAKVEPFPPPRPAPRIRYDVEGPQETGEQLPN